MQTRTTSRFDRPISVIGLGTWQLGADWGVVSEADALAVLTASVDAGVTFFDTADVYGDGRSEKVIGTFLRQRPELDVLVATKMGRRVALDPEFYTLDNFRAWTDRSRENLGVDTLDLVQLHTPPTAVIENDRVFEYLDTLVEDGAIARYGVSVETEREALAAIAHPGVVSIQIILNAFRLKPLDRALPAAAEAGVAVIVRVPLASGLLSGKYTKDTVFPANDHRTYNRHGEAFEAGETFSGVDFEAGVAAAQEFTELAESAGLTAPVAALAWLAQLPGVTTVIPGARSVDQARTNASAGSVAQLSPEFDEQVHELYDRYFRAAIHSRW